ncbi:hypothetical protein ABW21_db0206452 [Orbilia brochopaga]|nr:hypothetical protein ABW21_db0206452 [Drechslerella brochopaga]
MDTCCIIPTVSLNCVSTFDSPVAGRRYGLRLASCSSISRSPQPSCPYDPYSLLPERARRPHLLADSVGFFLMHSAPKLPCNFFLFLRSITSLFHRGAYAHFFFGTPLSASMGKSRRHGVACMKLMTHEPARPHTHRNIGLIYLFFCGRAERSLCLLSQHGCVGKVNLRLLETRWRVRKAVLPTRI